MRRALSSIYVTTPLLLVLFLLVWHFWVVIFDVSKFVVPTPVDVGIALRDVLSDPDVYGHLWFTIRGSVMGFIVAALFGIALGVVLGRAPLLERALSPFIVASQVVPKVAFVPLFILWFGFGIQSKVVVSMLLSFFPIFTNTILGMKSVDRSHKDVMMVNGASSLRRLLSLEFPSSLPYIMSGLEVGIVFAVIGAIVAEYLGGSNGLGFLAISTLNALQVDRLFAVIVVMTVMGFALYQIVVSAKRLTIPWHDSVQDTTGGTP